MRTLTHAGFGQRHQQKGAVLIIGLMILLLSTLIALSSMQNSNLQEKMASNSQLANRALQSAESASDSHLNDIMSSTNDWILTSAINQLLANGTNWPTTSVDVGDSGISTNLQVRTIAENDTTCGNSITAEENSNTIPCYLHQLTTTATVTGTNAAVSIIQGFTTR